MNPVIRKLALTAHITASGGWVWRGAARTTPQWPQIVGVHAIGLMLLFVMMHIMGGVLPSH